MSDCKVILINENTEINCEYGVPYLQKNIFSEEDAKKWGIDLHFEEVYYCKKENSLVALMFNTQEEIDILKQCFSTNKRN